MIRLYLSCLALSLCFGAAAQSSNIKPPKNTTKIIVLIKDSANTLLDRIASVLYDKGFTIDQKDEKVRFISTKDLPSKKWATIYKFRARINDTAIIFTGQIAFNTDTDILGTKEAVKTYWDIESGKGGSMREAWNELDAIAKTFGDKIIYSK